MKTKQDKNRLHSGIHINQFDSQYDNRVTSLGTADWTTLSDYFLSEPTVATDKTSVALFNLAHYKTVDNVDSAGIVNGAHDGQRYVRRTQENILFVDCLVLDFDGGLSIADAKERFKAYSYVGYTSHSHLKEDGVEKFRLLIQLAMPIPADMIRSDKAYPEKRGDWFFLTKALEDFAGPVDTSSFNSNQMYYIPSVHPDRSEKYRSWKNTGKPLDWTTLPQDEPNRIKSEKYSGYSPNTRNPDFRLDPDFMLDTKNGPVRVRDVDRPIDKVACPFHNDTVGGEFVARGPSGRISLRCKHCGTIYMDDPFVATSQVTKDNSSSSVDSDHSSRTTNSTAGSVELHISPDYLLRTKGRLKPANEIDHKNTEIICPFHTDGKSKGSLTRSLVGSHSFECDSCGPIYIDDESDPTKDHDAPKITDDGRRIIYPPRQPKIEDLRDAIEVYTGRS